MALKNPETGSSSAEMVGHYRSSSMGITWEEEEEEGELSDNPLCDVLKESLDN